MLWFSILRRKRLRYADFTDLAAVADQIARFIDQWNEVAHPFRWSAASFDKVLAKAGAALPACTPPQEAA